VMGSNLKSVPETEGGESESVWRLDYGVTGLPVPLLSRWLNQSAGHRQAVLHPDRVEVDNEGAVPKVASGMVQENRQLLPADRKAALMQRYRERGWGEVGQTSYERFLLWLEHVLNSPSVPRHANYTLELGANHWLDPEAMHPRLKPGMKVFMPGLNGLDREGHEGGVKPLTSDDLIAGARFNMPVHAFGYNWLASNENSAHLLKARIIEIMNQYGSRCQQVLLITHSMGGLVARFCASLPDMRDRIAGIVHGVMPTNGAPVAYRRCKVGMRDESFGASLVIGTRGQDVTAVFAQSPGALELLPTDQYAPGWIRLLRSDSDAREPIVRPLPEPGRSAYDSIYLEGQRWWGLINEAWLSPDKGEPIQWHHYARAVHTARTFHNLLGNHYHPNTYVFYGSDSNFASFESIRWTIRPGLRGPSTRSSPVSIDAVAESRTEDVRHSGRTPIYLGGESDAGYGPGYPLGYAVRPQNLEYSDWELHCDMQDGIGDGTVPTSSGQAPARQAKDGQVREQLQMRGFDHEGPFRHTQVQLITLQWILKIAGQARKPA